MVRYRSFALALHRIDRLKKILRSDPRVPFLPRPHQPRLLQGGAMRARTLAAAAAAASCCAHQYVPAICRFSEGGGAEPSPPPSRTPFLLLLLHFSFQIESLLRNSRLAPTNRGVGHQARSLPALPASCDVPSRSMGIFFLPSPSSWHWPLHLHACLLFPLHALPLLPPQGALLISLCYQLMLSSLQQHQRAVLLRAQGSWGSASPPPRCLLWSSRSPAAPLQVRRSSSLYPLIRRSQNLN